MRKEFKKLLKGLTECPGPTGQEQLVREFIVKEVKSFANRIEEDPLGNLIVKIGPDDGYKVGILAHMDEVSLIVSEITDNGLIGFELVGNIDPQMLLGCEVDILSQDRKLIHGVIGNKSRHLQSVDIGIEKISHKQMKIDIGAGSNSDVLKLGINIGCGIVFSTKFHVFPNDTVLGKALDNRMGCTVLIALESLSSILEKTTVYGMFTCQEEIGAKGAHVVAFDSRPNMTITLDTVPTKNPDEISSRDIDLCRGPVIRLFDWHPTTKLGMFTHASIKERLLKIAKKEEIVCQMDVLTSTFLDSSQVHLTGKGIPGGSICFPRRYSHSPVELSHLDDIANGIKLLISFIESIEKEPIIFGRTY